MQNAFRGPRVLIHDAELIFLTVASAFSVLGLVVSPLFFCFHLLDIVNKSSDLQNVFKAVTLNGSSILLTAVFGGLVVWIYAIVGFAFMADIFIKPDEVNGVNVDMCPDVFVCWVTALSSGLRKGDIGEVMELRTADDPWWPYLAVYQLSYYIIVITILLNLIFGIIIDTFSQLRSEKASNKRQMENTCFICGVDRFTFDTKGGGFQRHTDEDHSMWKYLYMLCELRGSNSLHIASHIALHIASHHIPPAGSTAAKFLPLCGCASLSHLLRLSLPPRRSCYLWDKEPTDYNGWEQHVADKVAAGDFTFMPQNNAIVLREHSLATEEENRSLRESIDHVRTQLDRLVSGDGGGGRTGKMMELIDESLYQHASEMDETKRQVQVLAEQNDEMRAAMRYMISMIGGLAEGGAEAEPFASPRGQLSAGPPVASSTPRSFFGRRGESTGGSGRVSYEQLMQLEERNQRSVDERRR